MTLSAKVWYLIVPIVAGVGVGGAVLMGREEVERRVTIPAGTTLVVALSQTVSADVNRPGDDLDLQTVEPLDLGGSVVVPAGSAVRGVVTDATSPDWGASPPQLSLRFTSLMIDDEVYAISTEKYWFGTSDPPAGERVVLPAGKQLRIRLTRPVKID
jgi:hypothetical protein